MNNPYDVLAQTARDFTYGSDIETAGQREHWRVHTAPGPFAGDCEDFALTLLYRIAGDLDGMFELIRSERAIVWWCKNSKGDDHICVELITHGFTDNVLPFWRGDPRYDLKFAVSPDDIEAALSGRSIRTPRQKMLIRISLAGLALTGLIYAAGFRV